MKLISKHSFLRQFSVHGIAPDRRYSPPQTLVFEGTVDMCSSWEMPIRIKDLASWISSLVAATHPEKTIYLYPRAGTWAAGDTLKLFQISAIFSLYGLKPTGDEVVEAEVAELDATESLFSISLVHGGTVSDDIFLIPDHGKVVLYADHHEAVHAEFGDGEFMNRYLSEVPAPA